MVKNYLLVDFNGIHPSFSDGWMVKVHFISGENKELLLSPKDYSALIISVLNDTDTMAYFAETQFKNTPKLQIGSFYRLVLVREYNWDNTSWEYKLYHLEVDEPEVVIVNSSFYIKNIGTYIITTPQIHYRTAVGLASQVTSQEKPVTILLDFLERFFIFKIQKDEFGNYIYPRFNYSSDKELVDSIIKYYGVIRHIFYV